MSNVYSSAKIFHFPERLQKIAAGAFPAPIHVRLKPTNRCNHRCSYCAFRSPDLYLGELMRDGDEIPPHKLHEIASDLVELRVRAVTFSGGGEPLCHPTFPETARRLMEGGVKVAVLTNGSGLEGETAELLARRAVWVRVSIDAARREDYARTRAVAPREFDRVCDNVRRFSAIPGRACVLGMNFIVTRENSGDVLAFLRLAREWGVDHVKVSEAVVSNDAGGNRLYMMPFYESVKAQLRQAIEELTLPASQPPGGLASSRRPFQIIDKVFLPDAQTESFERSYTWCPMARCLTVIAADQNVYTCQDKAYTASGLLGSIRDRSFSDLWRSDDLRNRLRALDPSRECRHHCVAHGKNMALLDYFEADREHLDFV